MRIGIVKKICVKCNEERDLSFFRKYRRHCILCERKESKIYRRNLSTDEKNEYMRRWYKTSKGIKSRKTAYNKKIEGGYYKDGNGKFDNLMRSSLRRGIKFDITKEELLRWVKETKDVCYYCGSTEKEYLELIKLIVKNNKSRLIGTINGRIKGNGLTVDRVSNENGYSLENIVKSCWICNSIKGVFLSSDEMKIIAKTVIQRLREENQ